MELYDVLHLNLLIVALSTGTRVRFTATCNWNEHSSPKHLHRNPTQTLPDSSEATKIVPEIQPEP